LSQLTELGLDGNPITDKGLAELKGLTALETLGVSDTQVTEAGVLDLQKTLPKAKVRR